MKNKKLLLLFIPLLLVAVYYFSKPAQQALAGVPSGSKDVLGSRVGTTTTGTAFYTNYVATSSNVTYVGGEIDTALVTFKITDASSTPDGFLTWSVLGSNDAYCDTASSTTSFASTVIKKDINWFDLYSGTIRATGAVATGTVQTLTNLNWNCLKVETNGSSSAAWVQLKTKDNK